MTLNDPLLHHLHHMCEKENKIKFHYAQNHRCLATIVYDDRLIIYATAEQCFVMAISIDTIYVAS